MAIRRGTLHTTLDELDQTLISELEVDARQAYSALAAKLSISSMTVSRRIKRLLSERIIQPTTMVNTGALGFHVGGHVWIKAKPGMVETLAEELATHSHISHVTITAGHYDVVAWFMFREYDDLLGYLTNELASVPGIANVQKSLFVKSVKRDWSLLRTDRPHISLPKSDYKCDDLDIMMIRELQLNPREDLLKLAAKLQTSPRTAGRRLENLLHEGFVKVISIVDPVFFGFIETSILIKAQNDRISAVANELAHFPQIKHIAIFNGDYDISITGNFRNLDVLHFFLEYDLGKIPGIMLYETIITFKAVKRSFGLP